MSDFTDIREQVSKKRADGDSAARQLAVRREQLKQVERELTGLKRVRNPNDPDQQGRVDALESQAAKLKADIDSDRIKLSALREGLFQSLAGLSALADPAEQVEELSDSFPILLFPLRIETRFKSLGTIAVPKTQLWVRIYPDNCQVDSFEELPSESEVKSTRTFWIEMWKAGSIEDQERGAWSALVEAHGSGRAGWLIEQLAPVPGAQKPSKVNPQDVVLVIIPKLDLTQPQQDAACLFWEKVWKADGDQTLEDGALGNLKDAVGPALADEIIEKFKPENLDQDPPKSYTRAGVNVTCGKLPLPADPAEVKTASWTQAPKSRALPDRFVVMCFNGGNEVKHVIGEPIPDGLATGPDPSLPESEQIKLQDGDLVINEDLRWMVDFDKAVEVGMGFKIELTPVEASTGFERLLVLGVRASTDEVEGQKLLETLITHHNYSKHGFSLVPQGSATNNTEGDGAAYTWIDDADTSYDIHFKDKDAFVETIDSYERRDGEWLAAYLGIGTQVLKRVPHSGGSDQGEARAMNAALWPATLGYFMEEMMSPVFKNTVVHSTRDFFTKFVSGRGPVPAVRVGRQPYGILPAMAFSRYIPFERSVGDTPSVPLTLSSYLKKLYAVLKKLDADWKNLSSGVAHVGKPGDPHQILLNIIGLHSGSVEYHQRYAESFKHLYNKLVIQFGADVGAILAGWMGQRGKTILTQLGYGGLDEDIPILKKFFFGANHLLSGPVVDDVPLSETAPIHAYTNDNRNYIEWLATSSFETIRIQDFGGKPVPTALLYLLLRHAMMLCQWDSGIRLLEKFNLVDSAVARKEPDFVHVQSAAPSVTPSKFEHLYQPQPLITGDAVTTLAEHILKPPVLQNALETADLRETIKALEFLKGVPTARLERLFSEHLDCCSYRLDAWETGITTTRLEEIRIIPTTGLPSKGIYIGAYGWLENVKPEDKKLTPVTLPPELEPIFQSPGQQLNRDSSNAGYIHAPSLNHATTAAILKNTYLANASSSNSDVMSVNLSSERARQALAILEGIRNGQTLSALLGYRFERGLHDGHDLAEVDKFIYPLRQAFPLVADKMHGTKSDGKISIKLLEARNVIDGVRLITHIREKGEKAYPFGLTIGADPGQLPSATNDEKNAINVEVDNMMNLHDAVSDLMLSESVYQAVLGNFERAAASIEAVSKGKYPQEPEVVMTPRSGITLTHRVALHLDTSIDSNVSPNAVPMTPRAKAEASLNQWLADRLPDPAGVVCRVVYTSPALTGETEAIVTQQDLRLQPIDLLYIVNLDLEQAMAELDSRIVQFVRYNTAFDPHPALSILIRYTEPVPGQITLFEVAPLIKSLRALLLKSRHLTPLDSALPVEAESSAYTYDFAELEARINASIGALTTLRDDLVQLESDASDLDEFALKVSDAFLKVALYGIPNTGTSDIHDTVRTIYQAILVKIKELTDRWDSKAADFDAQMATWGTLTTDEERFQMLLKAEGLISSTTTASPPADPNVFKADVEAGKITFDARHLQFKSLLALTTNKLVDFVAAVDPVASFAPDHDAVPFTIEDQKLAVDNLRSELLARVTSLKEDITGRVVSAGAILTEAAALNEPEARARRTLQAANQVLGDEAKLFPRFQPGEDQGLELQNCWNDSAALLDYLKTERGRQFPVDDWLYGVARVRDKMRHWENSTFLAEAFGRPAAELSPLQLPYKAADRWLALEFQKEDGTDDYIFDSDRLLYTAHFAAAFNLGTPQSGALLDEWTEVIPAKEEVTGVTFHFDRPNSEPPQVMLLAVPPVVRGSWRWDDLVAMLHETLEAAKKRAVEPAQVGGTNYGQFLPATLMAVTLYQITLATNLAFNNQIYKKIGP